MRTKPPADRRKHIVAGLFAAAVLIGAASASAAVQPKFFTPPVVGTLPTVLYLLPYAVSDHTGLAQQTGSGVATETIVSIGLPYFAPTASSCRVQVEWVEFDGTTAGFSGPFTLVGAQTLEFTTAVTDAVIITPFNQNVFSNLGDRPFEGFARIRTDCPNVPRLRVDAKYVTDQFTTGTPSTRIKRQEIKVVQASGNSGD